MDEIVKANYWPILPFWSGLVYRLETIMTIIAEETMYESSVVQYFTEKGIKQGIEQGGRERAVEDLLGRARDSLWAGRVGSVGRPYWGH